jgi:hypothetical protein
VKTAFDTFALSASCGNAEFSNNGTEPSGSGKSDYDDDCMQKKSENVAHPQDGIKPKKPQNSGRFQNSPPSGAGFRTPFSCGALGPSNRPQANDRGRLSTWVELHGFESGPDFV